MTIDMGLERIGNSMNGLVFRATFQECLRNLKVGLRDLKNSICNNKHS